MHTSITRCFVLAIAALSFMAADVKAEWAPDAVGINTVSAHTGSTYWDEEYQADRKIRNANLGVYAVWTSDADVARVRQDGHGSVFSFQVGMYDNSLNRNTMHAGVTYVYRDLRAKVPYEVGVTVGLGTGYGESFGPNMQKLKVGRLGGEDLTPIGGLTAALQVTNYTKIRVVGMPPVAGMLGYINLAVEFGTTRW